MSIASLAGSFPPDVHAAKSFEEGDKELGHLWKRSVKSKTDWSTPTPDQFDNRTCSRPLTHFTTTTRAPSACLSDPNRGRLTLLLEPEEEVVDCILSNHHLHYQEEPQQEGVNQTWPH